MLELGLDKGDPLDSNVDLLVIACGESDLGGAGHLERADPRLGGILRRAMADERFRAQSGQSLVAHTNGGLPARRIGLIGIGPGTDASGRALRIAAGNAVRMGVSVGALRAAFTWSGTTGGAAATEAAAEGAWLGAYRFDRYLTDERRQTATLATLTLCAPGAHDP